MDFPGKGRGVVASREFRKGDFVVEYEGDLIDMSRAQEREAEYAAKPEVGCYMYYFRFHGKHLWSVLTYSFMP